MLEKDHILVVDENDDTRELVTRLVERDFFEADVASFAWPGAALEFAASHSVRLLIANGNMPAMNGGLLVREMRERTPGLPVIVVAGDAEVSERAAALGADRFLLQRRLAFDLPDCVRTLLTRAAK